MDVAAVVVCAFHEAKHAAEKELSNDIEGVPMRLSVSGSQGMSFSIAPLNPGRHIDSPTRCRALGKSLH